jgi:tRNA threonylcarbamoyladenosine biosynthesis protein TsaE
MVTRISKTPDETLALGEELGRKAQPGLVVGLTGDLGAGKTQFIKGVARGLGVHSRVHSPTFTLVNHYSGGRLPCFHLDLYRLETAEAIAGAGLEEYFVQTDGVSLIEWFDRWLENGGRPTEKTLLIRMQVLDENTRELIYEGAGS